MKKNSQSICKKKLKELINTELKAVYITKKGKKFLNLSDAFKQQALEENDEIKIKKEKDKIMKIYKIISDILSENEWGIFFKGTPLQELPIQEGAKMYKVNEVNSDRLYDAIESKMKETESNWNQNTEEEQTDNESSIG